MIGKVFGMMFQPTKTWHEVADMSEAELKGYLKYPAILAIIPAAAWYYGTTQVGWSIGDRDVVRFSAGSAAAIAPLFYLAQLAAIWIIGYFVHWMADTYGAESTATKGMVIAGFCATPVLLFGIFGIKPQFWLDFLVGMLAACYAIYLLYLGIPIVMRIPEERGFLFASAVVAVGLVMAVVVMVSTVILWDLGFAPTFID